MLTFAVFIISLALIVLLFTMKSFELSSGRKIFLEDFFLKCDAWIFKAVSKIEIWWGHISFRNTKLIFSWIIVNIRKLILMVKRRFDHQQSSFFTKKEPSFSRSKAPASFFLKDVSDYKKSLRGKMEE